MPDASRWLCGALVAVGCAAVVCGTSGNRPRLSMAGALLQVIGAFGRLVLDG